MEFLRQSGYLRWIDGADLSMFQTEVDVSLFSDAWKRDLSEAYGQFIRQAVAKRQSEFIAGRYCAHRALAGLNISAELISVGPARQPLWPEGIVGSISHSQGYAIAVVAASHRFLTIGLDVENLVTRETQARLRAAVINDDELHLLGGAAAPEFVFTLIFSVKESLFKAVYPVAGAYFGFDAVSVAEIDWANGFLSIVFRQDLGETFATGTMVKAQFCQMGERILTFVSMDRSAL